MDAPLAGIRVVELSLATSALGAGMAAHLPGKLLQDLGASVTRVTSARRSTLDAGVELERAWDRGKEVVEVEDDTAAAVVLPLVADADVLFVTGPEHLIEAHGIEFGALARVNPRLVVVRVRPSLDAGGTHPDLDLLVEARAGVSTQIRTHRGGPAFPDLQVGSAGAALAATVGALAMLYEREATGTGAWAETSLLDGVLALLPMIIGRVDHMSPTTNLLWRDQGPAEALSYRCADGEYVQLWFGAKGAYEGFLAHVGDPPSEEGYNADLMSGAMVERGARWSAMFATRDRDHWLAELEGHDFRCEPVLRPGEALLDAHVREVGLAVDVEGDGITVLGSVLSVTSVAGDSGAQAVDGSPRAVVEPPRLLEGVRVLDMSAYLAGPVAPLVLAELGADVVKVEPTTGDVHRNMEPMFAAGQRGKRAVALDLKSSDAPRVLDAMFQWADVVHHNARVGLAERLGYDEATVRAANSDVVYSFSSGFGDTGPRALLPTNDQLMQALAGIEAGQGGAGQGPTFLVWGAVDVTGGWLSACGILAGLYARRLGGGRGQSVRSSLLGAALTLKSGAFLDGDEIVGGPVLDADQRGYGAAYRLYAGADDAWFALAAPDADTWARLRDATGLDALPVSPPPLRTTRASEALQPEEELLVEHFATKDAAAWVAVLRSAEVPVEPVPDADRTAFIARLLDDPVSRQLGRVVTLTYGARGKLEQPAFPLRLGPAARPAASAVIPALGEHTQEFLASLGFDDAARAALVTAGAIPAAEA